MQVATGYVVSWVLSRSLAWNKGEISQVIVEIWLEKDATQEFRHYEETPYGRSAAATGLPSSFSML
jgi:hypothetical protein